jgi:hypothetical protein
VNGVENLDSLLPKMWQVIVLPNPSYPMLNPLKLIHFCLIWGHVEIFKSNKTERFVNNGKFVIL